MFVMKKGFLKNVACTMMICCLAWGYVISYAQVFNDAAPFNVFENKKTSD